MLFDDDGPDDDTNVGFVCANANGEHWMLSWEIGGASWVQVYRSIGEWIVCGLDPEVAYKLMRRATAIETGKLNCVCCGEPLSLEDDDSVLCDECTGEIDD